MSPPPEDVLTPREVAKLFRVDARTVIRWARAGQLPHWKTPGGHHRFSRREVEALLGQPPAAAE